MHVVIFTVELVISAFVYILLEIVQLLVSVDVSIYRILFMSELCIKREIKRKFRMVAARTIIPVNIELN